MGDTQWRMHMKSLNTPSVLSAIVVVAMLTSPAFAQKRQTTHVNQTAVSKTVPGYDSRTIAGYDRDGGVVAIPDPDQR